MVQMPALPIHWRFFSNDEAGAVIIDNNGMAHAFWGRMYVTDADLTDGNSVTIPPPAELCTGTNLQYGQQPHDH